MEHKTKQDSVLEREKERERERKRERRREVNDKTKNAINEQESGTKWERVRYIERKGHKRNTDIYITRKTRYRKERERERVCVCV